MSRRVAITGMGMTTPFGGSTLDSDWRKILSGESVRRPVDFFDVSHSRCKEASFSSSFPPSSPQSRAFALAFPALEQALLQSRLLDSQKQLIDPLTPFSISTTAGAMALGEKFVRQTLSGKKAGRLPTIDGYQGQKQVLELQQAFGIRGRSHIVCNACASGANAIGHGFDWIQAGWHDCVIVGGYEALTEVLFLGFDSLQSLSTTACKPFDQKRDGLMLGEGAAFLVLETEEHALQRGVEILAYLGGYGHSTDTHHLTQPHPDGIALNRAIQQALTSSNITPEKMGYLNSHGTGTPMNDGAELKSYQKAFGESFSKIKVSSTKAAIGHTLGGAGCIEAVFAIQALREGVAPPQINTEDPLPEIADNLVKKNAPAQSWEATMSVNLGFGGSNAALVFTK